MQTSANRHASKIERRLTKQTSAVVEFILNFSCHFLCSNVFKSGKIYKSFARKYLMSQFWLFCICQLEKPAKCKIILNLKIFLENYVLT